MGGYGIFVIVTAIFLVLPVLAVLAVAKIAQHVLDKKGKNSVKSLVLACKYFLLALIIFYYIPGGIKALNGDYSYDYHYLYCAPSFAAGTVYLPLGLGVAATIFFYILGKVAKGNRLTAILMNGFWLRCLCMQVEPNLQGAP